MCDSEELIDLKYDGTDILMIEPSMNPWSDYMIDEIVDVGRNFNLKICCAYVDRYMRLFGQDNLIYA